MKLIFILLSVFVHLVYKVTLWLHVLKLDVAATMNVQPMKYVTLPLVVALLEKNVAHFVIPAIVPQGLIALPKIIGRPAPADIP